MQVQPKTVFGPKFTINMNVANLRKAGFGIDRIEVKDEKIVLDLREPDGGPTPLFDQEALAAISNTHDISIDTAVDMAYRAFNRAIAVALLSK